MRVVWLRSALSDIDNIEHHIEQDDPPAARRMEQRIKDAVALLEHHPHIGRPGRVPETRELIVSGTPYIVPYAVTGMEIVILAVIHGARRWPESF
jgi:toxin ParE1/3/4